MKTSEPSFERLMRSNRERTNGPNEIFELEQEYRANYVSYTTPNDYATYNSLMQNGSDNGLYHAGAIALDVAYKAELNDHQRVEWLQKANQSWTAVLEKSLATKNITVKAIETLMHHSMLPAHQIILLSNQLPSSDTRNKMHKNLLCIGETAIEKLKTLRSKEETAANAQDISDLAGVMSHLTILILLQRFTKNVCQNGEHLAITSTISQDKGLRRRKGSFHVMAWDVTELLQFDPEDDIAATRLIQVKSRHKPKGEHDKFKYTDDIEIVYAISDLRLRLSDGSRERLDYGDVLSELIFDEESNGQDHDTKVRLNQRTEALFTALER